VFFSSEKRHKNHDKWAPTNLRFDGVWPEEARRWYKRAFERVFLETQQTPSPEMTFPNPAIQHGGFEKTHLIFVSL
jgi:hypothetical protein